MTRKIIAMTMGSSLFRHKTCHLRATEAARGVSTDGWGKFMHVDSGYVAEWRDGGAVKSSAPLQAVVFSRAEHWPRTPGPRARHTSTTRPPQVLPTITTENRSGPVKTGPDQGGRYRIRTCVGVSRRIYSPLPLAARATCLGAAPTRYRFGANSRVQRGWC